MVALGRDAGSRRLTAKAVQTGGGPLALLERHAGLFGDIALDEARQRLVGWESAGISAVACTAPDFPRQLGDLPDAPALLWVRGDVSMLRGRIVSVIGARRPSPAGIQMATMLARALVAAGITVMSGLAIGIDAAAHRAALGMRGRSVAVIGSGLCHLSPPENADLASRLDATVSQFEPEQRPSADGFRRRNALMSALSSATVIVEAGERSGTRIQARHALAQGRPLFLMRAVLETEWGQAVSQLPGVLVLDAPEDLLRVLGECGI